MAELLGLASPVGSKRRVSRDASRRGNRSRVDSRPRIDVPGPAELSCVKSILVSLGWFTMRVALRSLICLGSDGNN